MIQVLDRMRKGTTVSRVEDVLQPGTQVLSAEEVRALDAFWRPPTTSA